MMCLKKQDLYNKFKGCVQVVFFSFKFFWVEFEYVDYFFEVELVLFVLVFIQMEEILSVNVIYQLFFCMFLLDLKYEVVFWKEGVGNKILFLVIFYGQLVWIIFQ